MNVNEETKLLKAFGKLFPEHPLEENRTPTDEDYIVMDPAHICLCVATSPEAKRVLSRFSNKNDEVVNIPTLDYDDTEGLAPSSVYNVEYLKKILNCFDAIDEAVTLTLKKDYPIKLVGSEFYFVLAPRINND